MYNNNIQQILPQDGLQTTEVSSDNVCQNVCNPTSRHDIALQSNSKSAQDDGWSNNGGCIHHDNSVVYHFSSMAKKECPCTSDGVTVTQMTPSCRFSKFGVHQFIGPDRDLIENQDIDHVCRLAKIIQDTGLPNG